jgi:hypothetical protein
MRYVIAPYLQYFEEDDLTVVHKCATNKRISAERYYACFAFDEGATVPIAAASPGRLRERAKPSRR